MADEHRRASIVLSHSDAHVSDLRPSRKHPAVLRYKADTLELLGTANTQLSDGWGLTTRGSRNRLLATDGSAQVSTLDARTLRTVSAVTVRDAGRDVRLLNELEFIGGEVWANIWLTDCIARVDPKTGRLNGWLLMHGLRGSDVRSPGEDVLNGIAWDGGADGGRLFVTGKLWPKLYEIRVVETTGELDTARQACIR
jgi:glutaminyl-peptide cyclotransferase